MTPLDLLNTSTLLKRTISRCPKCLASIPAEVIQRDGQVVMLKKCNDHGRFETVLANDPRFYHLSQGSPDNAACCESTCDCSSTQQADQDHDPFEVLSSCVALIEIVDSCNLKCPTCYAASPWGIDDKVDCISFENFRGRVQGVIDRKGFIDILQLSGGEPTIHPQFIEILQWSLDNKEIGYVLVNTNLVRIAKDEEFRNILGKMRQCQGKFELYAQFDGIQELGQVELRGADLRQTRRQAIDSIGKLGVPTTLVMVVTPQTIPYLGEAFRFGLQRPHCRGIVFQPMFNSGRSPNVESSLPMANESASPISVGDVILNLVEQAEGLMSYEDFTPLPCADPNCHTIGYLLRTPNGPVGVSKLIDLPSMQGFLKNRINFNIEDLAKCGCETEPLGEILKQFEIGPDQPFRIFIKPFMDASTYDQDRIDRCCTHVIRPDGKLDSFCHYYLNGGASGLGLK
ncbi:MAG: radical SAM protein [Planctomycetes bacterium]|nr:radical SAM protein [Planctomycetota bacterium]